MIPLRIRGATRFLGAPKDWKPSEHGPCAHLAVRDMLDKERQLLICESAWELTPAELVQLATGGCIILAVVGGQPPVSLYVQPAEPEPNAEAVA